MTVTTAVQKNVEWNSFIKWPIYQKATHLVRKLKSKLTFYKEV